MIEEIEGGHCGGAGVAGIRMPSDWSPMRPSSNWVRRQCVEGAERFERSFERIRRPRNWIGRVIAVVCVLDGVELILRSTKP
jgi:hypothetical protein